jgi:hypothetical protein
MQLINGVGEEMNGMNGGYMQIGMPAVQSKTGHVSRTVSGK